MGSYLKVIEDQQFVANIFHSGVLILTLRYIQMDPKSAAVLNEVIGKLQDLLGGRTGASSGPKEASIPDFDNNFAKCVEKSKSLSPEIQALTTVFADGAKYMKLILGFSASSKKYSPQQEEKLKQKFLDLSKQTEDLERKNAEHIDHCRTIRELVSVTFWVFVGTPQFIIKGGIESADFNAMKFQKKKNLDVNEWYKLLQISVRSLEKYVAENYPMGISFTGSNDNWDLILDGKTSGPTTQVKQEAPKPVQAPKAPVPVKKGPKKEMVGITYNISNFENENIELKAGELEMKHGVFLENSKGINLKIEPKFKSIVVNKCTDVTLFVNTCVSGVEIVNSSNVNLVVHERTPSISIDSSHTVKITINEQHLQCDIVSSKASQVTVSYEKSDGNESKAFSVGEQLITKWNPKTNKFQTAIYDKFL